jgi:hypothetical protein
MNVMTDVIWTREKLATKSLDRVKQIRSNAIAKRRDDIVALCDSEIAHRSGGSERRVKGIHLICGGGSGVRRNPDGTFHTGTWANRNKARRAW